MSASSRRLARAASAACLLLAGSGARAQTVELPNGQSITPGFAPGASLQALNPHLPGYPNFRAGWAVRTALSPNGRTLLVLTSGYNRLNITHGSQAGQQNQAASNEYVFVYSVGGPRGAAPAVQQVLQVPNSFYGLAWAPDGKSFWVSGGASDGVFVFRATPGGGDHIVWAQTAVPFHHPALSANLTGGGALLAPFLSNGLGFLASSATAGLAVTPDGKMVAVANIYNDSLTLIDTATNTVLWEYDLRPYNNTPALSGTPGGGTPYGVAIAPNGRGGWNAFVSSVRDRELVMVPLRAIPPDTGTLVHIPLPGNPNAMVVSHDGTKLYVAQDNADMVAEIGLGALRVLQEIPVLPVPGAAAPGLTGVAPNGLALSPDGTRLYVTEGGANALGIIDLTATPAALVAQIPTGWYPNDVAVSADGATLYVVNGKSKPGPDPHEIPGAFNQYVEQLEQAGLLTLPVPAPAQYAALSAQVARNNFYGQPQNAAAAATMAQLRAKVQHVIYIIKENRTFDQVLGDLKNGANADPRIAMWTRNITPSQHEAAERFVTLDNFYCAGEVSANGWPWSTGAREADYGVKTVPPSYAGRGFADDSDGLNRDVNITVPTAGRLALYPTVGGIGNIYQVLGDAMPGGYTNLLAGLGDDFATDGPAGTPPQTGNIWDSVLRAGLTVRNYGMKVDLTRYQIPVAIGGAPLVENPYATNTQMAWTSNPTLAPYTDLYFRGFDNAYPDYWRFEEWNREFQLYVQNGTLPSLSLVRFMHDHTGNFCPKPYTASSCPAAGLNTPELQTADNDYAVGLLMQAVAHSPYAGNTLIFVLEDDAQAGADHVDAHRSTAYVVGPYVKHGAVVSTHYNTVNMLRTIEDVLGAAPLNLNDAGQGPMADIFDMSQPGWDFTAYASPSLKITGDVTAAARFPAGAPAWLPPTHEQDWWARRTRGYDWRAEDRIPAQAYNHLLWEGMKGNQPYPAGAAGPEQDGD